MSKITILEIKEVIEIILEKGAEKEKNKVILGAIQRAKIINLEDGVIIINMIKMGVKNNLIAKKKRNNIIKITQIQPLVHGFITKPIKPETLHGE